MSRSTLVGVILALVGSVGPLAGCKKAGDAADAGGAPAVVKRGGDAANALWALAPDKLLGGIVATPVAMATVDALLDRLRGFAKDPELALLQMPLAQLTTILGSDTAHLADAGFATTKGFAFFQTEDQLMFAILPMGDRDKLVKTLHGQRGGASPPADVDVINSMACKVVQGVYACTQAKDLAALDRLGKGKGQLDARFAKLGARGDVEVFVAKAALGASGLDDLVAAATLDHGQLAIDVLGNGKPPALAALGAVDKPKADVTNAAGFIVANLTPMLGTLPPIEIAGVSLPTLARTVKGPLIAMFTVGALEFSLRVPLTDPAPMTALLGKCDELVPEPMRAKQPTPGACSLVIPNAVPVPADLWVEGNELRVATSKTPKARPAVDVLTPMGRELAAGGWDYAVWGRGSIVAPDGMPFPAMTQGIPQQALIAVRMYAQLSEFGMGVKIDDAGVRVHLLARTIWANPADVAEKLSAITADEIFKNSAAPKVSAIAAAAPTSPYAADLRAGQAGLMAPLAVVGMASAVAIPAFLDYTRKAKKSEAELQLNRLGKYARIAYDTNAAFPVGEAQTPMASCCEFPTRRCAPDPTVWASPVWQALDFQIDEPRLFRYSYTGTATAFTATAVGDLDCDQNEITYTLTGKVENGNPVMNLVAPPPNSD